jgi:hypothetical protein
MLARPCAVAPMSYDVLETMQQWKKRGRWRWPRAKDGSLLFVGKRERVSVARIARVTYLVARRCDGKHSIRDLIALVDCLDDPETVTLRGTLDSHQLIAVILTMLRRTAGLRAA